MQVGFQAWKYRRYDREREVHNNLPNGGSDFQVALASWCVMYPKPRFWNMKIGKWVYPCMDCSRNAPNPKCGKADLITGSEKPVSKLRKMVHHNKEFAHLAKNK